MRVPCAGGCGKQIVKSAGSADQPTCRDCRRAQRLARKCAQCGGPMPLRGHLKQRFCSRECAWMAKRNPLRACAFCGVLMTPGRPEKRFCSHYCAGAFRRGEERPDHIRLKEIHDNAKS